MHDIAVEKAAEPAAEVRESIESLKARYITAKVSKGIASDMVEPLDKELESAIAQAQANHLNANAETYQLYAESVEAFAEAEKRLREAVIAEYERTGQKTIDENLGVRVNVSFDVDQVKAVEWAKVNMPAAIVEKVDDKAVVALHKISPLDFVHETSKVTAVVKGL